MRCTFSKASPVNLDSDMVLRRYVFRRLDTDIDLSQVHVVTGIVANICSAVYILGKLNLSTKGKTSVNFEGNGSFSI